MQFADGHTASDHGITPEVDDTNPTGSDNGVEHVATADHCLNNFKVMHAKLFVAVSLVVGRCTLNLVDMANSRTTFIKTKYHLPLTHAHSTRRGHQLRNGNSWGQQYTGLVDLCLA